MAIVVFGVFEQNVDDVTDGNGKNAIGFHELVEGNDSFRFVSDIDDDVGICDFQYSSLHHIALSEFAGTILI